MHTRCKKNTIKNNHVLLSFLQLVEGPQIDSTVNLEPARAVLDIAKVRPDLVCHKIDCFVNIE